MCVHVIVTPLESRIVVFNNGTSKGFKENSPVGGHIPPKSVDGEREE